MKKWTAEEKEAFVKANNACRMSWRYRLTEIGLLAQHLAIYNASYKTNLKIEGLTEECQYLEELYASGIPYQHPDGKEALVLSEVLREGRNQEANGGASTAF